jgi:outer membrane protein assembly factor BamB
VFTLVSRDLEGAPMVVCVALDAASGKELWAATTGPASFPKGGDSGAPGNNGGDGPRSTPAFSANRVYVYSADMVLYCLDAAKGTPVWKKDILKELSGRNISWKCAMSPVIDGNLVFVAGGGPGESMLALEKATGAVAWKTGDDTMTHATPTVATIHGVRQVIFLMKSGLIAVESATGKELWKFPVTFRTATGCSPVVSGDTVFCTAGYEVGGTACQVTKTGSGLAARELWRVRGNDLGSLWSTPVAHDGYLYGMISFKKFADGPLKCVDLKTGAIKWQQPGFGAGNLLVAGDKLVALSDSGEVVVAEADPTGYKEVGRAQAVSGKCWSTPALSDGRLYVRSTKEGACLALAAPR